MPHEVRDNAKECGMNLEPVNKIIKQKREPGTVEVKRKGISGRKRNTNKMVKNSKSNPRNANYERQQDMANTGVIIHESAVVYS